MSGYQLTIGSLPLTGYQSAAFEIDVLSDEATFGDGVSVSQVMESVIRDGDLTRTTRYGNRVASFLVRIKGLAPGGLSQGEALFSYELDKINDLIWERPGEPASVLTVVRSFSNFMFEDLNELRSERVFRLTFEALPFVRSVEPVTIEWTGHRQMDPLTSVASWTFVSGSASQGFNTGETSFGHFTSGSAFRMKKTMALPLRRFLFLTVRGTPGASLGPSALTALRINGNLMTLNSANTSFSSYPTSYALHTFVIDVAEYEGQVVELDIAVAPYTGIATVHGIWSPGYAPFIPNADNKADGAYRPRGIDVIDVPGSARAPFRVVATTGFPGTTNGAPVFMYTGPDPTRAMDEGAAEVSFGRFTVPSSGGKVITVGGVSKFFPQSASNAYAEQVGSAQGRPPELISGTRFPDLGSYYYTDDLLSQISYPADDLAAISCDMGNTIVSASPGTPSGYRSGDAIAHSDHVLHPGKCGWGILDSKGFPCPSTITFYPHWQHHAAQ